MAVWRIQEPSDIALIFFPFLYALLVLPDGQIHSCKGVWNSKFFEHFKCKGSGMLGICQFDKLWAVSMPYETMNQILQCFSLFIWLDTYYVTIGA